MSGGGCWGFFVVFGGKYGRDGVVGVYMELCLIGHSQMVYRTRLYDRNRSYTPATPKSRLLKFWFFDNTPNSRHFPYWAPTVGVGEDSEGKSLVSPWKSSKIEPNKIWKRQGLSRNAWKRCIHFPNIVSRPYATPGDVPGTPGPPEPSKSTIFHQNVHLGFGVFSTNAWHTVGAIPTMLGALCMLLSEYLPFFLLIWTDPSRGGPT